MQSEMAQREESRLKYIMWQAHEHQHIERGRDWFLSLGIVAVSTALTATLFGNILFAILIIVAALTLGVLAKKEPKVVDFKLTDRGLTIGNLFYGFTDIESFWVDPDTQPSPTLILDTRKFMTPHLVIPIEGVDPMEVRNFLIQHVKEVEMGEPISHKILEFFGF